MNFYRITKELVIDIETKNKKTSPEKKEVKQKRSLTQLKKEEK